MKVKITTPENMRYYDCEYGTVINVPLETYVAAVVASEIGNAPLEACKAQAVAARTFALARKEPISDSASVAQAFRAPRIGKYSVCEQAAKETATQVLTYEGKLISAVYSQSNGGRVHSAQEQWGSFKPYLVSKQDPWCKTKKNGHGVGLCQDGAIAAAKEGHTYKEILNFYYPNTIIESNYRIVLEEARNQIKKIMAELG